VESRETDRIRAVLERIAYRVRPLVEHLAATERRMKICPVCLCEYILEPHSEECAYHDAREALALLDALLPR